MHKLTLGVIGDGCSSDGRKSWLATRDRNGVLRFEAKACSSTTLSFSNGCVAISDRNLLLDLLFDMFDWLGETLLDLRLLLDLRFACCITH